MKVYLAVNNPGPGFHCDVVFALYHEPMGSIIGHLWFFPQWTETFSAIPLVVPPGLILGETEILDLEIPTAPVPGNPPIFNAGEYTWAVAFFYQGTFRPMSEISTATVQVEEFVSP